MDLATFTNKRILFVVSGPSGAGKSTVIKNVMDSPRLTGTIDFSISATTRPPRPGETHGINYYFMDETQFKKTRDDGLLVEWAKVHTSYYGTPASNIEKSFAAGRDLIVDIDVQGAMQIKRKRPDAILIFIAAPLDTLRTRLLNRPTSLAPAQYSAEVDLRIENARSEMTHIHHYNYLAINEKLDECVKSVISIILAERLRIRPDM